MLIDNQRTLRLKTWLFRHRFTDWGEGVAEGLIFSLIAWSLWTSGGN